MSLVLGMYLHDIADPEASFTKEEMQVGKHTEYEKRLIQHYLDLLSKDKDQKNNKKNTNNSQTIDDKSIESKTILIQNRVDSQQNQKQFQSNQSSNAFGNDETSNDSVFNSCFVLMSHNYFAGLSALVFLPLLSCLDFHCIFHFIFHFIFYFIFRFVFFCKLFNKIPD